MVPSREVDSRHSRKLPSWFRACSEPVEGRGGRRGGWSQLPSRLRRGVRQMEGGVVDQELVAAASSKPAGYSFEARSTFPSSVQGFF